MTKGPHSWSSSCLPSLTHLANIRFGCISCGIPNLLSTQRRGMISWSYLFHLLRIGHLWNPPGLRKLHHQVELLCASLRTRHLDHVDLVSQSIESLPPGPSLFCPARNYYTKVLTQELSPSRHFSHASDRLLKLALVLNQPTSFVCVKLNDYSFSRDTLLVPYPSWSHKERFPSEEGA